MLFLVGNWYRRERADEMPGTSRQDLVALGFLGAGPVYHKDGRLSKDVITNGIDSAVSAVKGADAAVVVVGSMPFINGT